MSLHDLFSGLNPDFRAENSREARQSIEPKLSSMHHQIMYTLKKLGRGTFYQIAAASNLDPSQVWKRLSELERSNKVTPDGKAKGEKGRNVTVWKAV
jgi:predicted ArsR family transcriptional regulator